MRNWSSLALLAALVVLGTVSEVSAGNPVSVPEIGPASISTGLAILAGGVLMLRARRNRK